MACKPQDVKAITGSKLENELIEPFIDDADCIIDAAAECVTVTDACKVRACVNLAAHYLVTSRVGKASREIKRQNIEDAYDVEYVIGSQKGEGIFSTHFGHKANTLMQGILTEFDKPQAQLFAIGTAEEVC